MESKTQTHFDKGLLRLIQQKLEQNADSKHILDMLVRAGFNPEEVKEAIEFTLRHDKTAGLRKAELNNFLPPLMKKNLADTALAQSIASVVTHKGLFTGRLRRKDFIMGLLFFFGLGFVFLTIAVTWIQALAPKFWEQILFVIQNDRFGAWLIFIPFIFAPITIILLSLITRRLHNLELPGSISVLYLLVFITPFAARDIISFSVLMGMHIALFTLFILLLTKKGHPAPNQHGPHPESTGSIFAKILGYEQHRK